MKRILEMLEFLFDASTVVRRLQGGSWEGLNFSERWLRWAIECMFVQTFPTKFASFWDTKRKRTKFITYAFYSLGFVWLDFQLKNNHALSRRRKMSFLKPTHGPDTWANSKPIFLFFVPKIIYLLIWDIKKWLGTKNYLINLRLNFGIFNVALSNFRPQKKLLTSIYHFFLVWDILSALCHYCWWINLRSLYYFIIIHDKIFTLFCAYFIFP